MKYLDWLNTNPEKGYYWVKYQDCDEERIDEFTDWYDNAGNKERRFTDQPDEVISDRLTYDEYMMTKDCLKMLFEAAQRESGLKELLLNVYMKTTDPKIRNMIFDYCEFSKNKIDLTMAAIRLLKKNDKEVK